MILRLQAYETNSETNSRTTEVDFLCRHWLVDNNIRSVAVDDSLQFGLFFGGKGELIQCQLKIVQECLPLLARDWAFAEEQTLRSRARFADQAVATRGLTLV
jgi:hypothetical protein